MSIIRRKNQHHIQRGHTPVDEFFDRFFHGWPGENLNAPMPLDIVDDSDKYIVKADLPGMDSRDIDISIKNDILTIAGEKKSEHQEKGKNFYHMERSFGSFNRSVHLPGHVESDKIEATYEDGVLTLNIPKNDKTDTHKIEIKKPK